MSSTRIGPLGIGGTAGAATRKSSAIRAAQVEAARRAEEHRRWQEERQKGEERRRREEALVRDLDKRLDLWLAAVRYRQLADAVEAMRPAGGDEDPRARWLVWLRSYVARVEQEVTLRPIVAATTTSARVILQSGSAECFMLSGVKLPVTSVNDSNGTATVNCRASLTSEKPRVRSIRSKSSELNRKSTV